MSTPSPQEPSEDRQQARLHPNLRHLPVGHRVDARIDFRTWATFPYELDTPPRIRVLDEPTLPEPPRHGEAGGEECRNCAVEDADQIWTDELWRLRALPEPSASPVVLLLEPRAHCDLADLPPRESAQLGPLFQRVERAILGLGGVGRVHVCRWGDGGAHLHWWFLARPEGMMQLRGAFMMVWDDVLPAIDRETWQENLARVAASMAEEGGTAHLRLPEEPDSR
jgi:diadenosine tetraphosphate (Ap4A) HIT family hydrolase